MDQGCRYEQKCGVVSYASASHHRSIMLVGRFLAGLCLLGSLCACGGGGGDGVSESPPTDRTPPQLLMTSPADGASDAAVQRTVAAAFSEDLDPATLDTLSFVVTDALGGTVPGRVAWDEQARLAFFTPEVPFDPAASYTANLTSAITDLAGNPLAPAAWTFSSVAPVSGFDEPAFWLDENGNPAAVVYDHFRTGQGAILLDTGPAGFVRQATSPALFNFTLGPDQSLKLWIYVPQVAEDHQLILEFDQGGTADYALTELPALAVDGWYCLTRTRADFDLGGGFDWDRPIDTITISLTGYPQTRADILVYLDALWIGGRDFSNAVFTFDDGYRSDYEKVFPVLEAHGMNATSFIITGDIGQGYDDVLELSQMNQMYAAGWEFGNHTATHYGLYTDVPDIISQEGWLADLVEADGWLGEEGYIRARNLLAFPYGEFATLDRQTLDDEIRATGIGAARTVYSYPLETGSGRINPLRYPATVELGPDTSLAAARAAIDDAIRFGHSVVIYGHEIVDGTPGFYQWNRDDFAALIDYLALQRDAHLLRVPSFGELHAWLDPAP
jgi:peptidoglycan/xylan/chitin deacetylase (PgdA/CDA1 family)